MELSRLADLARLMAAGSDAAIARLTAARLAEAAQRAALARLRAQAVQNAATFDPVYHAANPGWDRYLLMKRQHANGALATAMAEVCRARDAAAECFGKAQAAAALRDATAAKTRAARATRLALLAEDIEHEHVFDGRPQDRPGGLT